MLKELEGLAIRLFECGGAVKIAEPPDKGFQLHIHRYLPSGAPLAPIYFETGALPQNLIDEIAFRLEILAVENSLVFDEIAGVPRAGTPFAKSLSKRMRTGMVALRKEDLPGKKELFSAAVGAGHPPTPTGTKALLVENIITQGDSVCEAACALSLKGYRFSDVLTIFSWGGGAQRKLQAFPFPNPLVIRALFMVDDLVEFYREKRLVSAELKNRVDDFSFFLRGLP